MLQLGVEEVTVPFGSCYQDLGGKTAGAPPATSLCQGRAESCRSPGNRGGQGSQVVLGSCMPLAGGKELMRISGLWAGVDRVSIASSCPKPPLLFSRGTQLPLPCGIRAAGDPKEIGGGSQQGGRSLLSSLNHPPVPDHLRFGALFVQNVRTSEHGPSGLHGALAFQRALISAGSFDLHRIL